MRTKAFVTAALAALAVLAARRRRAQTEDVWKTATTVPDLR